MARYSQASIEKLANSAHMDNPPLMAAIAMAESGGDTRSTNTNTNGTVDRGLWQINSVHSQFDPNRLFIPTYNARAAKEVLDSQGLGAWASYNNGSYQQFYKGGGSPSSAGKGGATAPGGGGDVSAEEPKDKGFLGLGPVVDFVEQAGVLLFTPEGWLRIGKLIFGVAFIFIGLNSLLKATTGHSPTGVIKSAADTAAKLPIPIPV